MVSNPLAVFSTGNACSRTSLSTYSTSSPMAWSMSFRSVEASGRSTTVRERPVFRRLTHRPLNRRFIWYPGSPAASAHIESILEIAPLSPSPGIDLNLTTHCGGESGRETG